MFLQVLFSPLSWRQKVLADQDYLLLIQVGWRMEGVEFKEEWQDEDFPRFFNLSSDQMQNVQNKLSLSSWYINTQSCSVFL